MQIIKRQTVTERQTEREAFTRRVVREWTRKTLPPKPSSGLWRKGHHPTPKFNRTHEEKIRQEKNEWDSKGIAATRQRTAELDVHL